MKVNTSTYLTPPLTIYSPPPESCTAIFPTSINSLSESILIFGPHVPSIAPALASNPAVKPAPYTPSICPLQALSPTSPTLSTSCHVVLQQPRIPPQLHPVYAFYVGETKNSLSTRINGHRFFSKNPNNLIHPSAIHTRSHHLLFNSW